MTKLFFWNNWHNGDIIFERPLVRRILDRYDVHITWGCWRNHEALIRDLPVTVIAHPNDDREPANLLLPLCPPGHIPIYLWVGQYPDTKHTCWRNVVEVYNRQVTARGLQLTINCGDVPMVDFPFIDIAVRGNAVYVENGRVRASQSGFEFDMRQVCSEFPELNFYCTADPACQAPNLFDASTLNLVELSNLSNRCIALIGKGSGTFACAMTEINRFKPQALMNFHSHDGPTFWEYPGCPTRYLERYEELREFLKNLRARPVIDLATASQPNRIGTQSSPASRGGRSFALLLADPVTWNAARQASTGEDRRIIRQLVQARRILARRWQAIPDSQLPDLYQGDLGNSQRSLLMSDLRLQRYKAPGEGGIEAAEQEWVSALRQRVVGGTARIQDLLALMLYFYPHQLPLKFDLTAIPRWLILDYCLYMLTPPPLFTALGEGAAYLDFLKQSLRYLRENAQANLQDSTWQQVIVFAAEKVNMISTWFNAANVKELFADRAWIIERALSIMGQKLTHEFGPRNPADRPIRLGILADNFGGSPETVATLPIFEYLGDGFDVTLYCRLSTQQPIENYCRSRVKALKVLPGTLPAQVEMIRGDDLDILFFATNIVAVTNQAVLLAAHRLARVQATSISSVVTTGFGNMDFYVSGTLTDPSPEVQDHYTEKLVRLEGPIHCFSYGPRQTPSIKIDRPAARIPADAIVFSCGANMYKIGPELIDVWARILAKVPNSLLLLYPFGPNWSNAYPRGVFNELVNAGMAKRGVAGAQLRTIASAPPLSREDIIEVLKLTDVYLDSFPFSGSTSLVDPLEVGLPCLVCTGRQMRGAMGSGMIADLNIPELIATNADNYVDIAVGLGTDRSWREQIGAKIRREMARPPAFLNSRRRGEQFAAIFRRLIDLRPEPTGKTSVRESPN